MAWFSSGKRLWSGAVVPAGGVGVGGVVGHWQPQLKTEDGVPVPLISVLEVVAGHSSASHSDDNGPPNQLPQGRGPIHQNRPKKIGPRSKWEVPKMWSN